MSVGRLHKLVRFRSLGLFLGRVPRSHHSRIHEFVDAVGWHEQLGVPQLNLDLLSRHEIGEIHGKNIWPVLFEQRSAFSLLLGLLELLLRLLALFDFGHDDVVADSHSHSVNGGARRSREHVSRIDWSRTFVAIGLDHLDVGDYSGNRDVNFGVFERQVVKARISLHEEIRRESFVRGGRLVFLLGAG